MKRVTAAMCCVLAMAARTGTPASSPASWEEAAEAQGLGEGSIAALERDKILVGDRAFKQVFSPYLEPSLPLFITSDSLLNAFHVLYEESILRLETVNARKLLDILEFVWKHLDDAARGVRGNPEVAAAAASRARVMIGTALALLGGATDGAEAALIREEAERVMAARANLKPAWLGPPDGGFVSLDYARYRPRGFYTKTQDLSRYFRAVSWLQSVPFRVEKDEELLAALMVGDCIAQRRFESEPKRLAEYRSFLGQFRELVGAGDDWDILLACEAACGESGALEVDLDREGALAAKRRVALGLARTHGLPEINDTVRLPPLDGSKVAEPNFRILAAARTPDSVMFFRTTDLREFGMRGLPDGLEVCAALGSPFAQAALLRKPMGEKLLATVDGTRLFFDGPSLYQEYLRCVAALLDEPEPKAPAFMASEAWRAKSCQSALGGWAQLRHTWMLQAKQSVTYMGMIISEPLPDVVEPDPEFFARMGRLVGRTRGALKEAGALDLNPRAIAAEIRDLARWLETWGAGEEGPEWILKAGEDAEARLEYLFRLLDVLKIDGFEKESLRQAPEKLSRLADEIERNGVPMEGDLAKVIALGYQPIGPLWQHLETLCAGLEAVARKELAGEKLTEDDRDFLKAYGTGIAKVMLYGGNSYLNPRDDAPRIADVHCDPNRGEKPYLEVGIGRPRALYVLWPGPRGEYLCMGAVLPYYEFESGTRLTDAEWKRLLDGGERPALPEWIAPIVAGNALAPPRLER